MGNKLDRTLFRGNPTAYKAYLEYEQGRADNRDRMNRIYGAMHACEKRLGHKWGPPHADGRDMGARCLRCGAPEQ